MDGVQRDACCAVKLFNRAIEADEDVNAMRNLAKLFEKGAPSVCIDLPRAVELYELAVEKNYAKAMTSLAALLREGGEG